MSKSDKCYEIGQGLGTVSELVFESIGVYLATKNIAANNQYNLLGLNDEYQPNINNGMLVYNILSGLGKVSKSSIDYGFEYICNNNQDANSNEVNIDQTSSNNGNVLTSELQADNYGNNF